MQDAQERDANRDDRKSYPEYLSVHSQETGGEGDWLRLKASRSAARRAKRARKSGRRGEGGDLRRQRRTDGRRQKEREGKLREKALQIESNNKKGWGEGK